MKKKLSRLTAPVLVLGAMLCFAAGAVASGTLQAVTAYLNAGLNITLNGETQVLLDANGNRIFPLTYNDNTYLPVRAVAGMVGLDVDWDGETQTVLLGEQEPPRVDLLAAMKPYTSYSANLETGFYHNGKTQFVQSGDGQTQSVGGIEVDHWLTLYNSLYASGRSNPTHNVTSSFNLEGKYSTLTFTCYTTHDTTLTVYGDNDTVLAQYDLIGGQVPQTFTVSLMGTRQLSFVRGPGWTEENGSRSIYCTIFNAYVE